MTLITDGLTWISAALRTAFLAVLLLGVTEQSHSMDLRTAALGKNPMVRAEFRVARAGAGDVVEAVLVNRSGKFLNVRVCRGDTLKSKRGRRLVVGRIEEIRLGPSEAVSCVIRAYHLSSTRTVRPGESLQLDLSDGLTSERSRQLKDFIMGLRGNFGKAEIRACQVAVWSITSGVCPRELVRRQGWDDTVAKAAERMLSSLAATQIPSRNHMRPENRGHTTRRPRESHYLRPRTAQTEGLRI